MAKPKFLYDNRLGDTPPVASSTAVGFDVLNLIDWRPYTWWQPAAMPATVTTDCGSAKAADYALIYNHNLGSKGASVEIRGSTDNFGASDVLVAGPSSPATDLPLLLTFNSASFRYWRVKVTGVNAPSIAIAAIGAALTSPVYIEGDFAPIDRIIDGQTNKSENGHPLGKIVNFESWQVDLTLPNVPWSWARSSFLPAWKSNLRGMPFGFIWDSDLFPEDVHLVQSGLELKMPHRAGSFADVKISLTGIAP